MGWGQLSNPENHQNIDFKTLEDGYIESGLSITNLFIYNFNGLGLGIYYRYGENAFETFSDNLAIKFNITVYLN